MFQRSILTGPIPREDGPDAAYVALALANLPTGSGMALGLVYAPTAILSAYTGLSADRVEHALGLLEDRLWLRRDAGWVWIIRQAEDLLGEALAPGDKRRRAILAAVHECQSRTLAQAFATHYGLAGEGASVVTPKGLPDQPEGASDAPSMPLPMPLPEQPEGASDAPSAAPPTTPLREDLDLPPESLPERSPVETPPPARRGRKRRAIGRVVTEPASADHAAILAAYHETLPELARVRVWNADYDRRIEALMTDAGFTVQHFRDAFAMAADPEHVWMRNGQNDRRWRADFAFFLQRDDTCGTKLARLLNGSYRRAPGTRDQQRRDARESMEARNRASVQRATEARGGLHVEEM